MNIEQMTAKYVIMILLTKFEQLGLYINEAKFDSYIVVQKVSIA